MSIIREKDLELFEEHIDKIQDEVKKRTWNLLEPKGDTRMEIVNKVIEFVKKNKRKIYGSYSHNKVVINKNKKDGFLGDLEVPDIDFYSPEPVKDMYEICNMFHKMGYNDVVGREAQHEETYKIFVDDAEACDISYVPKNIYNKIPFIEIEGINYVHPNWALIDYLRILTDPMTSWEIKLDKRFKRFYLLQKHYPFQKLTKTLDVNFDKDRETMINTVNKIFRFAVEKETIIFTGLYAYNYYLLESKINYKNTDIQYYELISMNYKEDANELISKMKQLLGNDFTYEEHYPYFQFIDFSVKLYYKEKLICIISGNNHKCLPYQKVKTMYFEKNKSEENTGEIKIASFNLLLLHTLINYMFHRTNDNNKLKEMYMLMISHLIQFRNHYLDKTKKNIFDGGIFSDFVIDCIGETISSKKEMSDRIKRNIKNRKPAIFTYRPDQDFSENPPEHQFKNSSVNKINNDRNLKLSNKNTEENSSETDTDIDKIVKEQMRINMSNINIV